MDLTNRRHVICGVSLGTLQLDGFTVLMPKGRSFAEVAYRPEVRPEGSASRIVVRSLESVAMMTPSANHRAIN
jgi:hypothetical protein